MPLTTEQRFEKVKALFNDEVAQQKVVRTRDEIPVSYALISNEWLTDVLCQQVPGARVTGFQLGSADEGTSSRRRIFIEYNQQGEDAKLPASVFCKGTQGLANRMALGMTGMAEVEVRFYNLIRPQLEINAPVAYYANINPESLNSIVMLEDMSGRVTFCDQNTPMSKERAKSQLMLLARLHGKYWENTNHPDLGFYQNFEDLCMLTENAINWEVTCNKGFEAAEEVIPEGLFSRRDEIWPATVKAYMRHSELPRTLLHSDVHLKNWYITESGEMGLGDW